MGLQSQTLSSNRRTTTKTFKMSATTGPVNALNKSKEDFIWFVKKAVTDKKSYSYTELYHCMLKMFADADTNNDGLVSKESFSKLVDAAGALPRAYGFAPQDSDLYKNEQQKEEARKKMFDSMDKKATGVITFDEWLAFCLEHIMAKVATLDPHPIIDHGSVEQYKTFIKAAVTNVGGAENTELYWFMLELFTDHDITKCGQVTIANFAPMMNELVKTAKKHGLTTPAEGQYETIFKKYDPRGNGTLTIDEWMKLANQEVFKAFI